MHEEGLMQKSAEESFFFLTMILKTGMMLEEKCKRWIKRETAGWRQGKKIVL